MTRDRLHELYWFRDNPKYLPQSFDVRAARLQGSEAKRRRLNVSGGSGNVKKSDVPEYQAMMEQDQNEQKLCASGHHRICITKDIHQMFSHHRQTVCAFAHDPPGKPSEKKDCPALTSFSCCAWVWNWHKKKYDTDADDAYVCNYVFPKNVGEKVGFCDLCDTPRLYCYWCIRNLPNAS